MEELEQMALEKYHLEPTVWWRYIDDVFLIWKHGNKELSSFLEYLNSIHSRLSNSPVQVRKTKLNF